jgi:hypothetical protein
MKMVAVLNCFKENGWTIDTQNYLFFGDVSDVFKLRRADVLTGCVFRQATKKFLAFYNLPTRYNIGKREEAFLKSLRDDLEKHEITLSWRYPNSIDFQWNLAISYSDFVSMHPELACEQIERHLMLPSDLVISCIHGLTVCSRNTLNIPKVTAPQLAAFCTLGTHISDGVFHA